jgi:predicted regulator of Ras-like GTPase activity (Roadblock/LC7/MglB family)
MNTPNPTPQAATPAKDGHTRPDNRLREDALVFYQEDMDAIQTILDAFLKQSAARCALLVDQDGHMITARGETSSVDLDTISALVAGSFAATKALAKQFGDKDFTALFHQGKSGNIQLSLVGDRALLTALFGDDTTIDDDRHGPPVRERGEQAPREHLPQEVHREGRRAAAGRRRREVHAGSRRRAEERARLARPAGSVAGRRGQGSTPAPALV